MEDHRRKSLWRQKSSWIHSCTYACLLLQDLWDFSYTERCSHVFVPGFMRLFIYRTLFSCFRTAVSSHVTCTTHHLHDMMIVISVFFHNLYSLLFKVQRSNRAFGTICNCVISSSRLLSASRLTPHAHLRAPLKTHLRHGTEKWIKDRKKSVCDCW